VGVATCSSASRQRPVRECRVLFSSPTGAFSCFADGLATHSTRSARILRAIAGSSFAPDQERVVKSLSERNECVAWPVSQ
jgi:hypothetical protein